MQLNTALTTKIYESSLEWEIESFLGKFSLFVKLKI